MHFSDFFCIFASRKGCCCPLQANAKSSKILVSPPATSRLNPCSLGGFPPFSPSIYCERFLCLIKIVLTTHSNSSLGGKGIISLTRSDYSNNAKRLFRRSKSDLVPENKASFRPFSPFAATLPRCCHTAGTPLNKGFPKDLWQCGSKITKKNVFQLIARPIIITHFIQKYSRSNLFSVRTYSFFFRRKYYFARWNFHCLSLEFSVNDRKTRITKWIIRTVPIFYYDYIK